MAARVWPVDAVSGAPSYTGRALRQGTVSPHVGQATGSRPLGGLSGVRPGTPTNIATASSTTWTVTPFLGMIDGEAAAIAGVYAYSFDTNQTGSVTAAAGSARIDRLDVQVDDPAESDGSSVPTVRVVYTAGSAGSGVPAAAPARTHPLALINVPTSGSPSVTWNASYYAAPGAYVPFNTLAGLQAWTTAGFGQHATVINDSTTVNKGDYFYDGSTWAFVGYNDAVALTPSGAWTPAASPNAPRLVRQGKMVTMYGFITWQTGSSYPTMFTIPAAFRPPTAGSRGVGTLRVISGASMLLAQAALDQATGVFGQGTGATGSLTGTGTNVWLDGISWWMD